MNKTINLLKLLPVVSRSIIKRMYYIVSSPGYNIGTRVTPS